MVWSLELISAMRLRALAQFLKSSLSTGQRRGSYKASFEFQNTDLYRIDYGLGKNT